jgi:hypothetical protein
MRQVVVAAAAVATILPLLTVVLALSAEYTSAGR